MQRQTQALLAIVFVQWALLTYVLVVHRDDKSAEDAPAAQHRLQAVISKDDSLQSKPPYCPACPRTVCPECPARSDPKPETWEGVAATLMLHSPKWFQRRYTVMVQNALANTPDSWAVQIFYTGKGQSQAGLDVNRGLTRLISDNSRVILTVIPEELSKTKGRPKQMWADEWIWTNMVADAVLVFSGNGAICGNSHASLSDFDGLDYVGSPWSQFGRLGGAGSTHSLRNRKAMLAAIQYRNEKGNPHDGDEMDDVFFVRTLLDMNREGVSTFKVATSEQQELFGGVSRFVENFNETLKRNDAERIGPPLVVSGTLPQLNFDVREKFLDVCPELKIIFPSLHDPNCFGANPNGAKCAESICALRKEPRKGGC